jgi:D-alanyl-lipoteichoic acid acyltransferase DltB (MBOAT superfamily)
MIFNSNIFLLFFFVVILLYWLVRNNQGRRDWLILIASFIFYGTWDWRFLCLLIITGGVDFVCAYKISTSQEPTSKKRWLLLSILSNLGTLGFFKYAGFFLESAFHLLETLGIHSTRPVLAILLPAGISFYTFQALSYTLDVYRGHIKVETNPVKYFAFLTFFPQLVAGPIERASFLLPQFHETRCINESMVLRGVWFILWGFFLKVVIADYFAPLVDMVFNVNHLGGSVNILATLAFGGQIYGDFAGYSLIAIGLANTMGFELSRNFSHPYLASNIQDFWRCWHQTLSAWFRDYLYIPLGGDRLGSFRTFLNICLTFLLAGLWHGANWTFLLWGLCHGLALGCCRIWRTSGISSSIRIPHLVGWGMTMLIVSFGWLFFRAPSVSYAWAMIQAVKHVPAPNWSTDYAIAVSFGLLAVWVYDVFNRRFPWEKVIVWPWSMRVFVKSILLVLIIARWGKEPPSFIYFQF